MQIVQTASKFRSANEEEKEQILEELGEQLKVIEKELEGKEFFGGESIGYVDVVAFLLVYSFQVRQEVMQKDWINEEKFPVLCKWMGKLHEIDVFNQCLPPKDKHYAYIRAQIEAAKSASK